MHIHYISEQNSILNHFLAQIRDVHIQKDSMRFRKNIERIGEIMAYELSKTLSYKDIAVQTPLGIKNTTTIADNVVLCSILRAGLALHTGFMNFFDSAENVVTLPAGKLGVIQGLEGYIVAEADGVLLICKKSEEQRIKQFVADVKLKYGEKYI